MVEHLLTIMKKKCCVTKQAFFINNLSKYNKFVLDLSEFSTTFIFYIPIRVFEK